MKSYIQSHAFTIIELILVITIIVVLASLSGVVYRGVNTRAANTQTASDLQTASDQLELDFIAAKAFPTNAAAVNGGKGFKASPGTTLSYTRSSDGQSYCLVATNTATGTKTYSATQDNKFQEGSCAAYNSCNTGDTFNGTNCSHTYAAVYQSGTSPTYSCNAGDTLSGSTCTHTTTGTYPATQYSCTQDAYGNVRCTYTCPKGGDLSGTTCTTSSTSTYPAASSGGTSGYYYCNSGDSLNGTTCTHTYAAS